MNTTARRLQEEGYLVTPEIIQAFEEIDRADFMPAAEHGGPHEHAEEEIPVAIGYGQTISQPLTVALMLEWLRPRKGDTVLDVGAGSGWTAALLARIVGQTGKVIAIERVPQLKELAARNIAKYPGLAVTVLQGDGSRGVPDMAPFDRIHVAAGAKTVPPALFAQLAVGGTMVIPIGEHVHTMHVIHKLSETTQTEETIPGFSFVPLVEGEMQ